VHTNGEKHSKINILLSRNWRCAQYCQGKTCWCECDAPLRQTKVFSEAPPLSANPHFCLLYHLRKSVDGSRFYSGNKCIDNLAKIFSDTNPPPR